MKYLCCTVVCLSLIQLPGCLKDCCGMMPEQPETEWSWTFSCTLQVASPGPAFRIDLGGEPDSVSYMIMVDELAVTSLENGVTGRWSGLETYHHEAADPSSFIVFEDMNFDGFSDLRLMEHPSAGPNTYWLFWLYSPENGTLVRSDAFDEAGLVSPVFIPEDRLVLCSHRDGMGMYGTETYKVVDSVPVMIERREISYTDSESSLVVTYERIGDRMVETERRIEVSE